MNNTEKNNSNIKQNLKTTKDATTQTETQIEEKPPVLPDKLAHNDTNALYKDKGNIYIYTIMDSNSLKMMFILSLKILKNCY